MLDSQTIGISIDRDWQDLYEAIWWPEVFAQWATGLSRGPLVKSGKVWTAEGPEGLVKIRFTDHNAFGIMDHTVDLGPGTQIYVPLRIIANGGGATVLCTLFRQVAKSDAAFAEELGQVARDLAALKMLVSV